MAYYRPVEDNPSPPDTVYVAAGGKSLKLPSLDFDGEFDVVVIGGGYVGCSAALYISEAGLKVAVLEGNEVGWGSASRNAGQVSAHASKLEPEAVLKTYGKKYGERLNEVGAKAPEFVLGLAKKYEFDVSAVKGGIVTAAHSTDALDRLRKRSEYWQNHGAPVDILDAAETSNVLGSEMYVGSCIDRRGIAINPLAFIRGIAQAAISNGAFIFEHTKVDTFSRDNNKWQIKAAAHTITADQILLCTNAYTDDIWPRLKRTIIPVRGYQIWTKPLRGNDRGKILKGISCALETRRMPTGMRLHHDGRLQFSGGAGLGRERIPNINERLTAIRRIFPNISELEVEGWWSGWVTRGIADGWRLHRLAPGLLTAIGCNGRGVAMGPIMGRELARCVCGTAEDDLILPISSPTEITGYSFYKPVAAMTMQYMKWRDRMEIGGAPG
jgi:glycine/D-amino acid oxidase-like deaminating enzyme